MIVNDRFTDAMVAMHRRSLIALQLLPALARLGEYMDEQKNRLDRVNTILSCAASPTDQ